MVEAWNPHVRTSAIPKAVLHTYSLVHIRDDITAGYVYVCKIRSASHWAPDKGRKGGGGLPRGKFIQVSCQIYGLLGKLDT